MAAQESAGVDLVDEPGSLCWTELYTSDATAARQFYGDVLGWRFSDMPMPGGEGTYTLITPSGLPEERMHGGLLQVGEDALSLAGGRPYWHPVFAVADCDAAVAQVTGKGGSVQMGPVDAEGSAGWPCASIPSRPTSSCSPRRRADGPGGHPAGSARRASTSISIFIRGSASPQTIMVAAGRTCPKQRRSTGQHGSKSPRSGSR